MSCYVIFYENGAKMMRPVLTAAEYRNLRNSNYQKRLVAGIRKGDAKQKMRLLQMNYSCMPGNAAAGNAAAGNAAAGNAAAGNAAAGNTAAGNAAAGNAPSGNATTPSLQKAPLKGCKSPSMSVGMDVDFDPSAPDYEEMMEKAPEMVLSKKDELGLLMLERSARKGYHLVFRRHFMDGLAEGKILENQEINLKWASELLGVKFDEAAKDITRVFFSTTASEEDLLFLDDALFEQTAPNIENLAASGSSTNGSSTNGSSTNGSSTNGSSTNGSSANGSSTNGSSTSGSSTNGSSTNGSSTNGSSASRSSTNGSSTNGSSASGSSTSGSSTSGSSTSGSPASGSSASGSSTSGSSASGSSASGSSTNGSSTNGSSTNGSSASGSSANGSSTNGSSTSGSSTNGSSASGSSTSGSSTSGSSTNGSSASGSSTSGSSTSGSSASGSSTNGSSASGSSTSGSTTNGSAANGSSTSRSAAGKENPSNSAEASQKSADAQQASNAQNPADAQQASNTQQASNAQNPANASNISPLYNGIPYSEIISKYWELYNFGKLPTMGDRNVKTFELAVTLRAICNYSLPQLEAVIPRYDNFPEQEWRTTLESALKEPRKGMPYRLRQVLLAIQSDSKIAATGGSRDVPPAMPQKLPKLLKLLSSKVPQMYKPAVCEAIFPALAIHLHGVKFRYWDNVDHEPTFMNVLIAPMSVGKGAIKKPIDFILADIKEADKPNRLREAEWKRKNPSGKTKAKDPRPNDICIQILIDNLTDAVFNQRVVDAHENGHRFVYTRVDEVEQLKKVTSRGTVDEVSILIRKAFDNAEHGQERVGADSITGIAPLRWNFNASTTIPNAHRFFLKSVNDGTLSRLNLSTIIKPRLEDAQENNQASSQQCPDDSLPIFGIYDDKFAQDLKPYLDRLSSASGLIECPQALKLAKELTRENDKRASLYESEAYRILSYRANVIAYLKAMVLYVAQGYHWSEDIAEYVRWSEQMDLWCKMRFFGTQLEEEILQEVKQINASPQNLLSTLPDEFTYEQFLRHRQQQGKCGDGKNTLRTWKHRGYVVYDEITKTWHKK